MRTKQYILINATPYETRVALTENGVLQELHLERAIVPGQYVDNERVDNQPADNQTVNTQIKSATVGNIYKGKVTRLLPGMQAVFVDIGLEQNGFLHARDIIRNSASGKVANHNSSQDIQNLVHEGQSIYVQVTKEALNEKGPRLSTELSLPSRNLIYLASGSGVGISHKITEQEQRQRLKKALLDANVQTGLDGGFVLRTCAELVSDQEIANDLAYLQSLWSDIQQTMQTSVEHNKSVALIYQELELVERSLRDFLPNTAEKIYIDSQQKSSQLLEFSHKFFPSAVKKIEHYTANTPLFEAFEIDDQIEAALRPMVDLECGGNIVIEQTESMTTVDVNTSSFVGKKNARETILKTNLDAANAIACQLRLRNIAGIVVVDFIDMQTKKDKISLLESLKEQLAKDRVATTVSEISNLGLVEITRQRTQVSLEQLMCEPCITCEGSGRVKSTQTVCYEILRKLSQTEQAKNAITIVATPSVITYMSDQQAEHVSRLERVLACEITLRPETQYSQSQYDIAVA